ncbi:hypothetical protein U9M48_005599 [Paspalum notatum var. saurae]|uniref:Chlorophyllase n=1 Tax=Paspalum notatum var. saurae TaxID=547442 RepID=A0AAQ3SLF9_PASNO
MACPVGTAVFQRGPHRPDARHVDHSQVPSVPKPLMVVTPTDAGAYPVAIFLHGFNLVNSYYESLLSHVASHHHHHHLLLLAATTPPTNKSSTSPPSSAWTPWPGYPRRRRWSPKS